MHGCSRANFKTSRSLFLASLCLVTSMSFLTAGLLLPAVPAIALFSLIPGFGVAAVLLSFHSTRKKIAPEAVGVDRLTGLPDREAFIAAGANSIVNAEAGTIGLVLCEVKGLFALNQCCGRLIGDDVLRLAAHRLLVASDQNGAVFRIGVDEFAVLVNRINGDRLTKIVLALRTFEFELLGLEHAHRIRLPAGFASFEAGEGFSSLVKRARIRLSENESPVRPATSHNPASISWPEPKLSTGELALPKPRTLRLLATADD